MPDITDARQVTMHYKRKGDRVDEVLHDVVLNHVNRLEQELKLVESENSKSAKAMLLMQFENERLREALEYYARYDIYEYELKNAPWWTEFTEAKVDDGHIARKALEGEQHGPSTD